MKYWWVNQNQTFQHETEGGYMWSPKRNANNARNQFYENMTKVRPGDILFSFRKAQIPCMGIITSNGYDQAKPEFGAAGNAWGTNGWMVNVDYKFLQKLIRPKLHMDMLAPLLPAKYAPLTKRGDGLQGVYLTELPEAFAYQLVNLIGEEARRIIEEAAGYGDMYMLPQEAEAARLEKLIARNSDIPETEKMTLINARRGQGKFRDDVLALHKQCPFTRVTNKELLKASHIKPWSKCKTNEERLDPLNGLALTPTVDHLFDKGFVSFEDEGKAIYSNVISQADLKALGLAEDPSEYSIIVHNDRQRDYLRYHRFHIFKKQGF